MKAPYRKGDKLQEMKRPIWDKGTKEDKESIRIMAQSGIEWREPTGEIVTVVKCIKQNRNYALDQYRVLVTYDKDGYETELEMWQVKPISR